VTIFARKGSDFIASASTVPTSGVIAAPRRTLPFPNQYTFSFPNSGTFAYMCRIHDNTVGTIVVNPAQSSQNPPTLALTGGGARWRPLALLLGALALLFGVALLRLRLLRH
jgi:hypothetical protein